MCTFGYYDMYILTIIIDHPLLRCGLKSKSFVQSLLDFLSKGGLNQLWKMTISVGESSNIMHQWLVFQSKKSKSPEGKLTQIVVI